VFSLAGAALAPQWCGTIASEEALRNLKSVSVRKQHPAAIQRPYDLVLILFEVAFHSDPAENGGPLLIDERGFIPRVGLFGPIGALNRSAAWLES
jgi:hypothetical protein